jgi:tetratricopeptide (TPR) repeat protein
MELIDQAVDSGVLYYNLGNVSLKSKQWGKALQYYEKAKRTLPRNRDLQKNRAVVLSRLNQESQGTFSDYLLGTFYFWHAFLSREESKTLFLGLSAVFWLFLSLRFRRGCGALNLTMALAVLLYGYVAFGTFLKYDAERPGAFAIVLSKEIPVRGNFLKEAESIFTVNQGTKVRILERQSLGRAEKWIKIELAAGQQGWILEETVGVI